MKCYIIKIAIFICLVSLSKNMSAASDSLIVFPVDNKTVLELGDFDIYNEGGSLIINSKVESDSLKFELNGESITLANNGGKAAIERGFSSQGELLLFRTSDQEINLYHVSQRKNKELRVRKIPLWLSVLPPLIAIMFALFFKEVLISLFMGIWSGVFIAGGMRIDSIYYLFMSLVDVVKEYVLNALNDSGHLSVIVFSVLIGGMVAIISKNGGMAGVVKALSKYAKSPRSTQFVTWLLGVAIFFDDYANTLIVGNTMRSVSDKFKISREKLAYIVDSTAAPVASVAFITTWIGAELGYIADGINQLGLSEDYTPYAIFISSLKYSFYPILTLIFILFLIYSKKDYGPMLKAEYRARSTGQVSSASNPSEDEPNMEDLSPVENAPLKWQYAVAPILTVIFVTLFGLLDTGFDSLYQSMDNQVIYSWASIWSNMEGSVINKLGMLIGSSDSYIALLWASLSGLIVAILMTVAGRVINLFDTMHYMVMGFKTMIPAVLILILAWALAITTSELHTADFISGALRGNISPMFLPAIVFVLAALISFSTGSSWSTMAILFPIAIPITYTLCVDQGIELTITMEILYNVIATVLAASVLGDHCSPISDTTILSSLASDCNHLDHVRTQMPYALTVGSVSIICVTFTTFFSNGLIILATYIIAILLLYQVVQRLGKEVTLH